VNLQAPSRRSGALVGRRTHRFLVVWSIASLLFWAAGCLWALVVPVGGNADEPAQLIKAAAVVRGEWLGAAVPAAPKADRAVTVPAGVAEDAARPKCYQFQPSVPAGCQPALGRGTRPTKAVTYVGRYPPLYYLLVGGPTLLGVGDVALRAVRVLSALWSGVMTGLALAIAAVYSQRRLLVLGVAVAATPMVLSLAGAINPNGLEIAAALATWTGLLVLFLDHPRRPPAPLVATTALAGCVLALCQGLSLLWLGLAGVVAIAANPAGLPLLLADQRVRRALVVLLLACSGAVLWLVVAQPLAVLPVGQPISPHAGWLTRVAAVLGQFGTYLHQAVGVFGWLDAPSPSGVALGWLGVLALVLFLGVATCRRSHLVLVGVCSLAAVAVPTLIVASQATHSGLVWQGRDGLPLWVGVPLLAGAVARPRSSRQRTGSSADPRATSSEPSPTVDPGRRLAVVTMATVASCQVVDLLWTLRRFSVGLGGPLDPFARVPRGWEPPVPGTLLATAAVVLWGLVALWVAALTRDGTPRTRTANPPASGSHGSLLAVEHHLLGGLRPLGHGALGSPVPASGPRPGTLPKR
jgi:hypothetical protein